MKLASTIAAGLLGLIFVVFGLNGFLGFLEMPMPPEGSPPALFFASVVPTGFLKFIKAIEIVGGLFIVFPKTRNIGLLLLGPIVVGILAYNIFIAGGSAVFAPPVLLVAFLAAFVLWTKKDSWLKLLTN